MTITNNEQYLAHYGVKGMKWGVRRTPEQLGSRSGYKKIAKIARKESYYDAVQTLKQTKDIQQAHKNLLDARTKWKKSHELNREFNELSNDDKRVYFNKADRSGDSPFYIYLEDKGVDPGQHNIDERNARTEYASKCKEYAESLLNKYKDKPIVYNYDRYTTTYSDLVASTLEVMGSMELIDEGY